MFSIPTSGGGSALSPRFSKILRGSLAALVIVGLVAGFWLEGVDVDHPWRRRRRRIRFARSSLHPRR
jgi:hypothetical protein